MFSPQQLAQSMLKSVTQEELNQCMQFCAKYNILYAMHKFPIKLQIIDERRKEKVLSAKQKEGSRFEKPSQSMAMQKQKQKVSKFQKPSKKAAKKFQGNSMKVDKYEPSQVQKYSIKDDDKQDYFEQKSVISKFEKNRNRRQEDKTKPASNHNTDDGPGGNDIDLVRLVSQLAVGGTDTNQKYLQPNDNGIFSGGYSSNKGYNYQNQHTNVFYKPFSPQQNSSLYQKNLAQQSARSLYYQQPREQYSNPYGSSPYSQLDKVNQSIYDIGNFMMSPYQNNNPIQSPYVTQFRGFAQFNGESDQKDRKLERNLFNEKGNRDKQISSRANVNYGLNQAPKPQFGREINSLPVSHPHTQIYNNSQPTFTSIQPQSPVSQHYRNLNISQSPSVPNLSGFQQQYIPASPRMHTPRANRSPSPLSNSASCRDFFNQSQKQKSVDRSGVSRSKSRRKEKPGGSKSFYQPSSSARRVVRKERIDDDAEQYEEVKRQIDQSPIQEQSIRQNKVKGSSGNVKYPNRITRQTDLSGLSGYDPSTMVSKTTKSQQFVQNINKSQTQHQRQPAINKNTLDQQPFKQTPKLSNIIQQSPQFHSQRSSQSVQLNNIDDDIQRISSSRRKVPSPILKIDLTSNNQGDSIRKK